MPGLGTGDTAQGQSSCLAYARPWSLNSFWLQFLIMRINKSAEFELFLNKCFFFALCYTELAIGRR